MEVEIKTNRVGPRTGRGEPKHLGLRAEGVKHWTNNDANLSKEEQDIEFFEKFIYIFFFLN